MTATAFYLLASIAGGFVLSLTVHINKKGLRRAPKVCIEINIQVFQEDGTCCAYKFQRLVG